MSKVYLATKAALDAAVASIAGKADAASVPSTSVGVGAPSAAAPDGSSYFERNTAGEAVAEWARAGGAWTKVLATLPYMRSSTLNPALAVPSNTYVPIPCDDVHEDASGMIDATDKSKINILRSGLYDVSAFWGYSIVATGTRHFVVAKNGDLTGPNFPYYLIKNETSSTGNIRGSVAMPPMRLQVGDYLQFIARAGGVAVTVERTPPMGPEMCVRMVAP